MFVCPHQSERTEAASSRIYIVFCEDKEVVARAKEIVDTMLLCLKQTYEPVPLPALLLGEENEILQEVMQSSLEKAAATTLHSHVCLMSLLITSFRQVSLFNVQEAS